MSPIVRLGATVDDDASPRYKVVRIYRQSGRRKTMRSGLLLADAQAWCSRKDTECPKGRWFDAYYKM